MQATLAVFKKTAQSKKITRWSKIRPIWSHWRATNRVYFLHPKKLEKIKERSPSNVFEADLKNWFYDL
jgi:hypothetical protein